MSKYNHGLSCKRVVPVWLDKCHTGNLCPGLKRENQAPIAFLICKKIKCLLQLIQNCWPFCFILQSFNIESRQQNVLCWIFLGYAISKNGFHKRRYFKSTFLGSSVTTIIVIITTILVSTIETMEDNNRNQHDALHIKPNRARLKLVFCVFLFIIYVLQINITLKNNFGNHF